MTSRRFHALRSAGFTLVEVLIASTLAALVFAAVMSSYLFLGRGLTRLVNQQEVTVQGRRTIMIFSQDARMATKVSSFSGTQVTFTVPNGAGGTTTVSYVYNSTAKTFTRTDSAGSLVCMTGVASLTLAYYDLYNNTYANIGVQSIKRVELSFTLTRGSAALGTYAEFDGATHRLLLRNKPLLS